MKNTERHPVVVTGDPSDPDQRQASGGQSSKMITSNLVSLIYLRLAASLHQSDVWIGEMDANLPKSSNRIETFVFPSKNMKEVGSVRRRPVLEPLYFKTRNKFGAYREIQPNRYVVQGRDR